MYFWRIEALKARLIQAPLSDREVLPYFVLTMAITWALFAAYDLFPAGSTSLWSILGHGWSFVLVVVGTLYIYRQNGGSAGEHLLQRYLVIGWVVSIRWLTGILAVLGALTLAVMAIDDLYIPESPSWQEATVIGVLEALYYWRLGHHVSQVAHPETRPEARHAS